MSSPDLPSVAPTPYAELNAVLAELVNDVHAVHGDAFVVEFEQTLEFLRYVMREATTAW